MATTLRERLARLFGLEGKASRTAKLIAWAAAGQPVWTPRDLASLAREGFAKNAKTVDGAERRYSFGHESTVELQAEALRREFAGQSELLLYENNTSVSQSAVVAVNALADRVQELINSGADPAELQAFVDMLRANDAALSEAIKARTAAVSEPAPEPVEPLVQPES
jgi:hypothetical protein